MRGHFLILLTRSRVVVVVVVIRHGSLVVTANVDSVVVVAIDGGETTVLNKGAGCFSRGEPLILWITELRYL